MFHIILFFIITLIDLSRYIYIYKNKVHNKTISLFFHVYFCFFVTFIYKNEDLIICSCIYFISDSLLNTYFRVFKTFNKFHHLLILILLIFNKKFDKYILNLTGIHEFSTIFLCLSEMEIINKIYFDLIFPISFILCRLIIYNYYLVIYIYLNNFHINYETLLGVLLLNIMNIGITLKMKLLSKIYNLFIIKMIR